MTHPVIGMGVTMYHKIAYFPGTIIQIVPKKNSDYPDFYFQLDYVDPLQPKIFKSNPYSIKLLASYNKNKEIYIVQKLNEPVQLDVRESFVYPGYFK